MTTETLIVLGVLVVIAVLALGWFYSARNRRARLRERFGPEYDRTVRDVGSEEKADALLHERARRVSKYHIRDLKHDEQSRFSDSWRRVQAKFVDDPAAAVTDADMLVTEVMTARGYPTADFERRAEDLTVDHPDLVEHYRHARAIAVSHARGGASTEDLRQAIVHYRALFADLLEDPKHMRKSA
jgi:FtsZ-interacting cell division protein ZipA